MMGRSRQLTPSVAEIVLRCGKRRIGNPPALGSATQWQAYVSYITLLTRAGDVH
jgi:hypothetical protein